LPGNAIADFARQSDSSDERTVVSCIGKIDINVLKTTCEIAHRKSAKCKKNSVPCPGKNTEDEFATNSLFAFDTGSESKSVTVCLDILP